MNLSNLLPKSFNQILLFRTNDLCKTLHVFDICALATLQTFNTLTIIEAVLAFSLQLSVFLWHEYKTVEKILILLVKRHSHLLTA